MSDLQTAFDKLIEEQRELQAKFQTTAQALFKETTKKFFEGNPGVTAVIWTQYTPYFNDGDTCEFSVNDPNFTNANEEQLGEFTRWGEYEGEDESVWSESSWGFEYAKKNNPNASFEGVDMKSIEKFSKMIQSTEMEDVMKAMFGDHVKVTATREGFNVDDCDHD